MTYRASRGQLLGAETVVIVTVTYGDRLWRFSQRLIDVATDAGEVLPFQGGIDDADLADGISGIGGEPEFPSLALAVYPVVDVAEMVTQGFDLDDAVAEVALLVVGHTWEQREILLTGRVVEPTYGALGEPVEFSVESNPWEDTGRICLAGKVVNATTWPTSTISDSPPYPFVFGRPGRFIGRGGSATTISGSPAIPVEISGSNVTTLLISDRPVYSGTVTIGDGTTTEAFGVTTTTDGLGQTCVVVDISAAATIDTTLDEYWVLWTHGGAAYGPDYQTTMDGAGDVLREVLRRSTIDVDYAAFQGVLPLLNEYVIGGYVDDDAAPWDWVVQELLPILPIDMVGGPSGVYPILWPLRATAADAVARIVDGEGPVRVSPVTYVRSRRDAYDRIDLRYARGAGLSAEQFGGSISLAIAPVVDDSSATLSVFGIDSMLARISSSRVAVQSVRDAVRPERVLSLDTNVIYDRTTAFRVASEQLYIASATVREVAFDCPPHDRWIQPGSVVLLTSTDLHLADQVAVVMGRAVQATGRVVFTLHLWTFPARDIVRVA